jgi:hypothetical protein
LSIRGRNKIWHGRILTENGIASRFLVHGQIRLKGAVAAADVGCLKSQFSKILFRRLPEWQCEHSFLHVIFAHSGQLTFVVAWKVGNVSETRELAWRFSIVLRAAHSRMGQ